MIKYTIERWRSSGSIWDSTSYQVYEYNAQGLNTKNVHINWSVTTHLRISGDSILTSYNASGTIPTKDSSYAYSTTAKKFFLRGRNTYVPNGSTSTAFRDTRDTLANVWKPAYKDFFTYSSSGTLLTDTLFIWNTATSTWRLNSVVVSTPLSRGHIDNLYYWNTTTNSFDLSFRTTIDTNSYGQQVTEFYEDYNAGVWETNFGYRNYYELYGPAAVGPVPNASRASAYRLIRRRTLLPPTFSGMCRRILR